MDRSTVMTGTAEFVNEVLLDGSDDKAGPDTPLLEWGVLNSLNIARLLNAIRERFGVSVPPEQIVGRNFRDLNAVTDLVMALAPQPQPQPAGAGARHPRHQEQWT